MRSESQNLPGTTAPRARTITAIETRDDGTIWRVQLVPNVRSGDYDERDATLIGRVDPPLRSANKRR